jgi:uncharacterized protein YdhG (YjbR/CyaY superfamily)
MVLKALTVSDYILALPTQTQKVAQDVRDTIKSTLPSAVEVIKYGIPAFQVNGKSILYFGVWKKHIGLYPIYKGDEEFERVVGRYRAKKDTVQFMLDAKVPLDLIADIARHQSAGR